MMKPHLIEVYDCLCDETRLRIVHLLARSSLCVGHLQEILALTQVAASKHLAYLRKRGLVEGRRHAQWMIYTLPAERPRELDWQLRCLQDCLGTHPVFRDDLGKLKAMEGRLSLGGRGGCELAPRSATLIPSHRAVK